MDAPTTAEVIAATKLEDLKAADAADQDRIVAVANGLLLQITGINLAQVPAWQEPLVLQAVKGLAESEWFDESEEQLETLADFHLIKSFSAGLYSETRRDAGDAIKAKMLHPWPWLNQLLWLLVGEGTDKYDYWWAFFGGQNAPASEVVEVDWSSGLDSGGLGPNPWGGASVLDPWEQ